MEFRIALIMGFALYLFVTAIWIWLCLGVRLTGARKYSGWIAIHISFAVFCVVALRASVFEAVLTGFTAPLVLLLWSPYLFEFYNFLLILIPIPAVAAVAVLTAALSSGKLRKWSGALSIVTFLFATLSIGDIKSRSLMCASAGDLSVRDIKRNSFWWSLRNTPQEFQTDVHAVLDLGATRMAWSYRDLNWYHVNNRTIAIVESAAIECF